MKKAILLKITLVVALLTCSGTVATAYFVLTHEAIIDVCWDSGIRPLLLHRYPNATDEQLKEARAYAYGGCVAPDMGYYPFGSRFFTDLLHYVRTGDMVNALLEEAQEMNEYAFALGFLCHYNADKYGHPMAVNAVVPIAFPEDREKFGPSVTYEQHPIGHVRVEFGFDVVQTARGNYVSDNYHAFIGFKVSKPVLQRAFLKTYGLEIDTVFKDLTRSIETFRWIVKNLFPVITRTAWAAKKSEIRKTRPTATTQQFAYKMRRSSYVHEFGRKRERPGFFPGMLAVVIKVIPKTGTMRSLKVKIPGPEAEQLFIRSFDTVTNHYLTALNVLKHNGHVSLADVDFDTGNDTHAGEYAMADRAYIGLLLSLYKTQFSTLTPGLKQNLLTFYSSCSEQTAAVAGPDQWKQVKVAMVQLGAAHPTAK